MTVAAPETNALLRTLEPAVRAQYAEQFQPFELRRGAILYIQGDPLEWVYFPQAGLISILSETLEGEAVVSGMVGREGAFGVFEICGTRQPYGRAVVQIAGQAVRIRAAVYRKLFNRSPALRTAVHKYVELLLMETRQLAVCNALHSIENRLSRSMLDALDRSSFDADVLPLTQEMLAQMLGAQRTTVAVAISKFQRAGLIRSGRGSIEVLDRAGLERGACNCLSTLQSARRDIQSSGWDACEALLTE
jgi:CRP-like cAMP-binding protein